VAKIPIHNLWACPELPHSLDLCGFSLHFTERMRLNRNPDITEELGHFGAVIALHTWRCVLQNLDEIVNDEFTDNLLLSPSAADESVNSANPP